MTRSNRSRPDNPARPEDPDWMEGDLLPYDPVPVGVLPHDQTPGQRRLGKLTGLAISLLILVAPTLVAAVYLYGFATDKYEADTVVSLRTAGSSGSSTASSLLGLLGTGLSMGRASDESYALVTNIRSRESLQKLDEMLHLRDHFSDPSIDYWQRLSPDADFEGFYAYYSSIVSAYYDEVGGQIVLTTRAFTPQMTHEIALRIAQMGEALVNQFNLRAEKDRLSAVRRSLDEAEQRLKQADADLTRYRISSNNVDPVAWTAALSGIIGQLEAEATKLQAEIRAEEQVSGGVRTPKVDALANQLAAVQSQILLEQARLTGDNNSLAPAIEEYQNLLLAQEIARQAYTAALAALHSSIAETENQKLYIVSIVAPTEPQEARLPNRSKSVLFVLLGSIAAWFVVRLLVAAIRDHAV